MTIRHLKIFIAVCENGSITKAAEILHIAQPAVSFTISEIEKYYKVILFDRINQRLVITDAGKNLLLKAREVLASFDDFENVARQGSKQPTIRIGSSLTVGKTMIPEYIKKIKFFYPDVKLSVIINNTGIIERELEQGNLDFGMVEGQVMSSRIRAVAFGADRLAAVCAVNYEIPEIEIAGINFDREYYMISHKNKKFSPLQRQIYDLFRTVIAKDDNRNAFA